MNVPDTGGPGDDGGEAVSGGIDQDGRITEKCAVLQTSNLDRDLRRFVRELSCQAPDVKGTEHRFVDGLLVFSRRAEVVVRAVYVAMREDENAGL